MAAPINRENIAVVVRTYKDAQGNDKRVWQRVGEIATFENEQGGLSKKLTLYMHPGLSFSVFPVKERDDASPATGAPAQPSASEDINIDDIPF